MLGSQSLRSFVFVAGFMALAAFLPNVARSSPPPTANSKSKSVFEKNIDDVVNGVPQDHPLSGELPPGHSRLFITDVLISNPYGGAPLNNQVLRRNGAAATALLVVPAYQTLALHFVTPIEYKADQTLGVQNSGGGTTTNWTLRGYSTK